MAEPVNGNNSVLLFAREGTGATTGAQWGDMPTTPVPHKLLCLAGAGTVADVSWIKNMQIASDPNPRDSRLGRQKAAGSYDFYPNIKSAAWLHEFILGVRGAATGAGPYVSIAKISSGKLPSLSIEMSLDYAAGTKYAQSHGNRIDKTTIETAPDGNLTYKCSVVAKVEAESATAMTGSVVDWSEEDFFDHMQMTKLQIDGADFLEVATATIDIAHNHFVDHYVAKGGGMLRSLPRRQATVGGTVNNILESDTLSAIAASGDYVAFEQEWTNGVYSINWLLPRIKFKPTSPKQADGPISLAYSYEASKDQTLETSVVATTTGDVIEAGLAA